jgi:hypothetical protein
MCNPYNRLISCYRNKVINPSLTKNIFACYDVNAEEIFETFVQKICDLDDLQSDRHFRSQSSFLYNGESILADFVGRFVKLEQDWKKPRRSFKFGAIPHNNASGSIEFEINPRTKNLIQLRSSSDFENFYTVAY